eukprot:scaffold78919_cov33-Phaeocystis_antarctica.AAC.1
MSGVASPVLDSNELGFRPFDQAFAPTAPTATTPSPPATGRRLPPYLVRVRVGVRVRARVRVRVR